VITATVGILADDLTGANDTGVQFSRLGGAVVVLASLGRLPERLSRKWDAVALNTDSRNLPPGEARARVAAAWAYLARQAIPLVYKKIDSTLRGNLAPELEELFAQGVRRAFLAPAFPLNGRTVEGGVLKVDGVPVHQTEMRGDALSPVRGGHIPSLLAPVFGQDVEAIGLECLERGAAAVARRIAELEREGRRMIVCDAREQRDLAALAEALGPSLPGPLLVGSAGLARELAECLRDGRARRPAFHAPVPGAVLVAAGSRSAVTAEQVRRLRQARPTVQIEIAPDWVDGDWDAPRCVALAGRVLSALVAAPGNRGAEVLLITIGAGRKEVEPECFQKRSARLNRVIGAAILEVLARGPVAGLVLTGGDVAAAAIEALEAEGIELGEEVLPGIPLGWLTGGPHARLPIVTKAGGFGAPDALARAVQTLRRGPEAGVPRAEI
jgi:uncharacterized protein YgbK (DUF1537 family)